MQLPSWGVWEVATASATVVEFRRPEHLKHEGGWYRVERRIWHNDSVCKTFQEAAAWNYLIGKAEHEPRQRRLNGHEFRVERGQLMISQAALAKYFEWTQPRLNRFLNRLAEAGRIIMEAVTTTLPPRYRSVRLGLRITICNYDYYQDDNDVPFEVRDNCVTPASPITKKERKNEGRLVRDSYVTESPKERISEPESNYPPPNGGAERHRYRFDEWWRCWDIPGTKTGKAAAERKYRAVIKADAASHEELCAGVRRYMAWCRRERREVRFIKDPATWLNKGCWADELVSGPPQLGHRDKSRMPSNDDLAAIGG